MREKLPIENPRIYWDFSKRIRPNVLFSRASTADEGSVQVPISRPRLSSYRLNQLKKGLLLEASSKNKIPNSFNSSGGNLAVNALNWGSQGNGIANTVTTEKGPVNSTVCRFSIAGQNTTTLHPGIYHGGVENLIAGRTYTASLYVKPKTSMTKLFIFGFHDWNSPAQSDGNFEFGVSVDNTYSKFYEVDNGWWRVEHVFTPTVSNKGAYVGIYARGVVTTIMPVIGWEVDYCGFQVEDTTDYGLATSYIPTTSGYVTRAQEVGSFPIDAVGSSDELTLVLNVGYQSYIQGRVLQLSDGNTSTNGARVIFLEAQANGNVVLGDSAFGTIVSGMYEPSKDGCTRIGITLSKDRSKCHVNINGKRLQSVSQGISVNDFSALKYLYLGLGNGAVGFIPYLVINKVAVWNTIISPDELDTLVGMV